MRAARGFALQNCRRGFAMDPSLVKDIEKDPHAMVVRMPTIMGSSEGKIIKWLRHEGEAILQGESLCQVEVDDLTVEIESPYDGVLADILLDEYEIVPTDAQVAVFCDSEAAYFEYFEKNRIAAQEAELLKVLEELKESQVRKPLSIVNL